MKRKVFPTIIIILCIYNNFLFSQESSAYITVVDTFLINLENKYELKSLIIIPNTEIIQLKNRILKKSEYKIDYPSLTFQLSDSLDYSITDTLLVTYQTIKLSLKKEYKRRELVVKYDEKLSDSVKVVELKSSPLTMESIFGQDMQRSGTLIRGFSIGTNQDFSLQSGLRLQLSGHLTDDIEVVAALTDENTPIQPEGNTERLDELDKVFIQIRHKNAVGTFGDYEINRRVGEFGVLNRRLQGLLGEINIGNYHTSFGIASSKGKFNRNNITGQDGVQGPYRLLGANNERNIIIIAGSERVYLDGQIMRRGEGNDYTIDYSIGEVTFTPNRIITSASRIIIEFEYSDRKYSRNLYNADFSANLFKEKLKFNFQFIQESDDKNSPIDISLSDEDKNILMNAGDNINKAIKSGVSIPQADSLGIIRGTYVKVDTLINDTLFSYYVYNPGNDSAIYNVIFSYVGEGNGDYIREGLGTFRFVGIGLGAYLPIIYLPMPEKKQFGNFLISFSPQKDIQINLELAGSIFDQNQFSGIDDNDNSGYARNFYFKLNPVDVSIGKINFGKIGLSYKDRYIENSFSSIEYFDDVEFNRNYNILDNSKEDESLREFTLNLIPLKNLNIFGTYSNLQKGDNFQSNRFNNTFELNGGEKYQLNYNFDFVNSENLLLKSKWYRHRSSAFYSFNFIRPGVDFLAEDRVDKIGIKDSVISGSIKYNEFNPYISLFLIKGLDFKFQYTYRDDYVPLKGFMLKESESTGESFELNYRGIRQINSTLNITLRNKKYTNEFKQSGMLDNKTVLVRSISRFLFGNNFANGDLYYEVSTQKTARMAKTFLRVEKGTGNYIYLGDLNNNGIADENEFQLTLFDGEFILLTFPTDELFPVIDLKTNTRWKLNFSQIVGNETFLEKIISSLSTETVWRVEENSKEKDLAKIYLMNFQYFLNDSTTIQGSNFFQQDLFIFENKKDLSFRFRYNQRKSLSQFSGGLETGYNRERSFRIRFKMIEEISNQTDFVNEIDNLIAPVFSNRNRKIESNNLISDFSYRPQRNIEVGFKIKTGKNTDYYPQIPTEININSQSIRFNFSLVSSGRLRIEFERFELLTKQSSNYLPFELTEGNVIGKNYFLRLNFDYRFTANLQANASYDGRLQGKGKIIHTMRAEVRAFF